MTVNDSAKKDSWAQYKRVGLELKNRTVSPLIHPTFVIYFVIVMLLVGPVSIWVELYAFFILGPEASTPPGTGPVAASTSESLAPLRAALLTFFPAVTATTALQLIWVEKWKQMRAVAVLFFVVIAILAACMTPRQISDCSAILLGAIATLIALWLWWIANANNIDLHGENDLAGPIGGETATRPLNGNLNGFDV